MKSFCFIGILCVSFSPSVVNGNSKETFELKVGDISVTTVMDTFFDMPSTLIKNGNKDTLKNYMPDGKTRSSVNIYIVKTGKQTVLVDAGNGAHMLTNLKSIGITPDNVDLILLTHGHNDHVGGLVKSGKAVFQKAKVLFSEKEKVLYEDTSIEALPDEYKPHFKGANQVLKIYGDRVKTFNFGDTVASGVVSVDISGHTAGHSGFLVVSNGQKLLIAGDFLHIVPVQFPHPEYSLIYDRDPEAAAAKRKKILEQVSIEKILVAGMHIPFPGIGQVASGTVGYVFTPVKR
jgi:glyoxylase-like metal-dependent hydrolase (beta-lactamase superfamily II)